MDFVIEEVTTAKALKDFVDLPYRLYRKEKNWIPPMRHDEMNALIAEKNPAFEFCKVKFWVAYSKGKCVGRIGGIIIPPWNEKQHDATGRFTRPEFENDKELARALFDTVGAWLKKEGMSSMAGPLGFSNLDHQGLLIEGHDWLPSIASDYHFAYYGSIYEELGFAKEIDWVEFRITFPKELPEKSVKVGELIINRYGLKVVNFKSRKEMELYKEKIFELFNKAFSDLYGTYPLPEKLCQYYIDKYFGILNPRYVKIILDSSEQMAGFIIGMPSLSVAMKKANGRLLPFGWYHLMQALEHPREMDLLLTGIKPELQRLGVSSLLLNEIWREANKDGVEFVETTAMLENNSVAIQMWKMFDHIQHKRKRCYRRLL